MSWITRGLQVATQSTHLLKDCYPQMVLTHTIPKFCLQSSWITGAYHYTCFVLEVKFGDDTLGLNGLSNVKFQKTLLKHTVVNYYSNFKYAVCT